MIEILKTIFYLILFVVILWGAYYSSKKISTYSLKFTQSKYMRIVDQLRISKETGLAIIQVGSKYMLICISGNKSEVLRELEEDDLVGQEAIGNGQANSYISFKHMLDEAGKKLLSITKSKLKIERTEGVVKNKDQ